MNYKQLLERIQDYAKGRQDFIYGLDGLDFYSKVPIGRGMYILVGGQSGSGKTSFVDTAFILNIFKNRIKSGEPMPFWIYNSMERHIESKLAKWSALMLYWSGTMIDVPILLNLPNKKRDLNNKDIEALEKIAVAMDKLQSRVDFYEAPLTAKGILDNAMKVAYQRGVLLTSCEKGVKKNGVPIAEFGEEYETHAGVRRKVVHTEWGTIRQNESKYFPNDEDEVVFMVNDHVGKVIGSDGFANTKTSVDDHSQNMALLRDKLKWCPVDISQFNRENQDTTRNRVAELDIKERDFKNTSTGYENADIVLGLINPHKLGHTRYKKLNVRKLVSPTGENRLRVLKIVKQTYGPDDIQLPLKFLGENGFVEDLPQELNEYEYDQIQSISV